jgi:transposase
MNVNHYIGFDVHKKSVSYCVKGADGRIFEEGKLRATHQVLRQWAQERREAWSGAMEATLFSGWIYDALKPFAAELEMGHPAMMKAIGASKKKNDKLDARKIADLVRCNLLPACYVAPPEIRELRQMLRYRNLVVAQAVRMKNKMSGLLMEAGAEYNKQRLHGKEYFTELLDTVAEVPESVKDLLRLSRGALEMFETTQRQLLVRLQKDPLLAKRVILLKSIRGVGEVTALTWALEVSDPQRFSSVARAVSYCGLTSALISSADKQQRAPISKQRNAHLQTVLIEAAKLAPRRNPQLAALHERELIWSDLSSPFGGLRSWFCVFFVVAERVMFPPEPPVAITTWPERRAAVKGAPVFGAAKRTLDGEHRSGTRYAFDGRRSGNMFPLVGFEPGFWTAGPMTAQELARRLITLIFAGRNRMAMIRRELPRTEFAGWVRRPFRTILVEGSPFRGPSAVIGAAVQSGITRLSCLGQFELRFGMYGDGPHETE